MRWKVTDKRADDRTNKTSLDSELATTHPKPLSYLRASPSPTINHKRIHVHDNSCTWIMALRFTLKLSQLKIHFNIFADPEHNLPQQTGTVNSTTSMDVRFWRWWWWTLTNRMRASGVKVYSVMWDERDEQHQTCRDSFSFFCLQQQIATSLSPQGV